jgi:hypothetical protein
VPLAAHLALLDLVACRTNAPTANSGTAPEKEQPLPRIYDDTGIAAPLLDETALSALLRDPVFVLY